MPPQRDPTWPSWLDLPPELAHLASARRPYRHKDYLNHKRKEVSAYSDAKGHGLPTSPKAYALSPSASAPILTAVASSSSSGALPSIASRLRSAAIDPALKQADAQLADESKQALGAADGWQHRANSYVGRGRWWPKQAPSSRSEAAALAFKLERLLGEGNKDFRTRFSIHAAVFEEATRQVAVHCAERGEVLSRLLDFFTMSFETTARLAEDSARAKLGEQMRTLEEEAARLRAQLRDTQTALDEFTARGSTQDDVLYERFDQLPERAMKRRFAQRLAHERLGDLVFKDVGGGLVSLEAQVNLLSAILQSLPARAKVALLAEGANRWLPVEHRIPLLRELLRGEGLDNALAEVASQEQLLQGFLHEFEQRDGSGRAELFGRALSLLDVASQRLVLGMQLRGAAEADTTLGEVLIPQLFMALKSATAREAVVKTLLVQLEPTGARDAVVESVSLQPEQLRAAILLRVLAAMSNDGLDAVSRGLLQNATIPAELRLYLFKLVFDNIDMEDREHLLPSAVGGATALQVVEAAGGPTQLFSGDSLVALQRSLSDAGTAGAKRIVHLFEGLRDSDCRVAFVRELLASASFGADEQEMVRQVLQATAEQAAHHAASEPGASASKTDTTAAMARRFKTPKGAPPTRDPVLMSKENFQKVCADLLQKKIIEDGLSDMRGKPRMHLSRFFREFQMRKYGSKAKADQSSADFYATLRHLSTGPVGSSVATRAHLIGSMLGYGIEADEWSQEKEVLYFACASRLLLGDATSSIGSIRASTVSQVRDNARVTDLRERLAADDLPISLGAVSPLLSFFCPRANLAKKLLQSCKEAANPAKGAAKPTVHFDTVMLKLMRVFDEVEEEGSQVQEESLESVFDACAGESAQEVDFGLFQKCIERALGAGTAVDGGTALLQPRAREVAYDQMLDMYDEAIAESSSLLDEDTDVVTRAAWLKVGKKYGVITRPSPAFISVVDLLSESAGTKQSASQEGASAARRERRRTLIVPDCPSTLHAARGGVELELQPKSAYVQTLLMAALSKCFLFRHLDDDGIGELIGYMREHRASEGQHIIQQGDKGDYFYVCESGAYDVLVNGRHVHTYTVDEEGGHPCFGELALMYAKPRAASVVAKSAGRLWKLGRAGFRSVQSKLGRGDLTKVLRKVDVFSSLSFGQLQQIRDSMTEVSAAEGDSIFRQGDVGDSFFVVMSGEAEVLRKSAEEGAEEVQVALLGEATYFGERALLKNEVRAASIRAYAGPLKAMRLAREDFERLLGPLEKILDADRRAREARAQKEADFIESSGLANATRESFGLIACVHRAREGLPRAMHRVVHHTTDKSYTLVEEGIAAIVGAREQERVGREIRLWHNMSTTMAEQGIQTASIPTLLRRFQTESTLCYLYRGQICCDLMSASSSLGGKLDERSLCFVIACIVQALDAMQRSILLLYRNLVPENVYLTSSGYAVLMDFRYARRDDGSSRTLCGSPHYLAPEVVRGAVQTSAIDWWSLGVLAYEMVCGESPMGAIDADELTLYKRILSFSPEHLALPEEVSPAMGELLADLLEPDPEKRLGAEGGKWVMKRSWFKDINWDHVAAADSISPLADRLRAQLEGGAPPSSLDEAAYSPGDAAVDWLAGFQYPEKSSIASTVFAPPKDPTHHSRSDSPYPGT